MAGASGIKAGSAFVEITAHDANLRRGLRQAAARLKAFGAGITASGMGLIKWGGAVTAALLGAGKVFASMGDNLAKMSKRTGVSVEALSALKFAAERSGSSVENLEKGIRTMQRSIYDAGEGLKTSVDVFKDLNLSYEQLSKMSPEDQFRAIASRLKEIEDPSLKAALAMKVFGRAGTSLIPMLNDMEALEAEARRLGLVISSVDAKAAEEFTDAMSDLWSVIKRGTFAIGAALAPMLKEIGKQITETVVRITAWINQNPKLITSILKLSVGAVGLGVALVVLGKTITLVGIAAKVASVGIGILVGAVNFAIASIAFLVTPIGLVTAGLVAMAAFAIYSSGAMGKAASYLSDRWNELKTTATKAFKGIKDALMAGDITLAAKILWTGLQVAWIEGTQPLYETWKNLWIGIKDVFVIIWKNIKSVFIAASAGFRHIWDSIVTFMASGLVKIWDIIQKVYEGLKLMQKPWTKKVYDINIKKIEASSKATLDGLKSSHKERIDLINEQGQKEWDANEEWLNKTLISNRKGADADIAARKKHLGELKTQLADLVQQAEDEKNAKHDMATMEPYTPPGIPKFKGVDKELKSAVYGTFRGGIAGRIGPGKVFSQMLDKLGEIEDNTSETADNTAEAAGNTFE